MYNANIVVLLRLQWRVFYIIIIIIIIYESCNTHTNFSLISLRPSDDKVSYAWERWYMVRVCVQCLGEG